MNKKELLIDFLKWYNPRWILDDCEEHNRLVDLYLKSINYSNEPNEFRAIGNNEKTHEKCKRCKILEFMIDNGLGWDDMKNDV